jgi:hypothetical protein
MSAAVLAVLLAACGGPSPSATATPTSKPSPRSVVAQLRCRIAVATWNFAGGGWKGGWVTFPGGAFTADPSSNVQPPGDAAADGTGLSYDVPLKRWLPVAREMVRPDGQVYVYMASQETNPEIRMVDADGRTTVLGSLPKNLIGYHLVGAQPEGVYVTNWGAGLWRLPYSGGVEQLNTGQFWTVVSSGYAYGPVAGAGYSNPGNQIDQLNLSTTEAGPWFVKPDHAHWWIPGFDASGEPIVVWVSAAFEIWLGISSRKLLYSAPVNSPPDKAPLTTMESAIGDAHGIWVATRAGLYLYTEQAGWELASSATSDGQRPDHRSELVSGCF